MRIVKNQIFTCLMVDLLKDKQSHNPLERSNSKITIKQVDPDKPYTDLHYFKDVFCSEETVVLSHLSMTKKRDRDLNETNQRN